MKSKNWPYYSNEEIKKVVKVLKSGKVNYWTGNECSNFEKLFAKKFNLNHCIAVANGTVALGGIKKKSMMKFLFLANHINPQQAIVSAEENLFL